ncbi:hypothetical protein HF313_15770 [Massilia atriviolacea]|uniref:Uncharacterized protein n=1 Tax=Massilia atriviolacea TaxID=2495579 RepID=A0A430HCQ1_9BURK|nr:hypothetical protein [Massilia atriviolacea]RSZ55269.1 hypothetical protein EJB06_30225 [Massilia atriviolacea]
MAPSRLSLLIAAPVALLSALALGLGVLLHLSRLDEATRAIDESRLRFTLGELRADVEARMALGMPLAGLPGVGAALERELGRDPAIAAISVVDSAGKTVFHAGAPDPAAPALLARQTARDWLLRETGGVTLGARLSQRDGAPAGTLLLRHAMRRQQDAVALVARELALAAVCAALLTTLCFVFGVDLLVRRMRRTLAGMHAALGDGAPPKQAIPHANALVGDVNVMAANALHDLAAARDTLAPAHASAPLAIE